MSKIIDINSLRDYKEKSDLEFYGRLYETFLIEKYDNQTTYTEGAYVHYFDGNTDDIYKCTTSMPSAGDFDTTYWTKVNILQFLYEVFNVLGNNNN